MRVLEDSEKRGLCLEASAKVNVGLRVTGKRPDGYHELITIMVPVTLYDSLELIPRDKGVSISCGGFPVPADEGNLAFRAAEAFFGCSGIGGGVEIRLRKGIPVAAGLGGGSSDAAATLLGLNRIYGLPLDEVTMGRLALGLGADVPFFLLGRPALARGVGEVLEPLEGWPELWYLIVTPAIEVSTAWVYANLKIGLTSRNLPFNMPSFEATPFEVADFLVNDLEAVTAARFPVITRIKALMLDAGAEGALMSGSGPSVYGIFTTEEKAERARERFEGLGRVFLARGIG
jgi:4-diphosphocytidyl-2-C-methyl-D-erythritol kinase